MNFVGIATMCNLKNVKIVIACAIVFLSGCVVKYVTPETNDLAKLEYISEVNERMFVHFYEGSEQCTDRLLTGGVEKKSSRVFDVEAGKKFTFTTVLDGNAALLFGAGVAMGGGVGGVLVDGAFDQGCKNTIEFLPKIDGHYTFRMLSDGKNCGFQFYEKSDSVQSSTSIKPVSYVKKEWIRPASRSGPFCKKHVE